jgi:dGTPase
MVGAGPQVTQWKAQLEAFLHRRVYRHHRVLRMAAKGKRIIQRLFEEFCRNPDLLPERYRSRIESGSPQRTICDYLAGMTDRFIQEEYLRLFQPFSNV